MCKNSLIDGSFTRRCCLVLRCCVTVSTFQCRHSDCISSVHRVPTPTTPPINHTTPWSSLRLPPPRPLHLIVWLGSRATTRWWTKAFSTNQECLCRWFLLADQGNIMATCLKVNSINIINICSYPVMAQCSAGVKSVQNDTTLSFILPRPSQSQSGLPYFWPAHGPVLIWEPAPVQPSRLPQFPSALPSCH